MLQAKYLKHKIEMSSLEMLIPFRLALASVRRLVKCLCICLCRLVFTCYSRPGLGTLPQWCSQNPQPLPLRSGQPVAHPHLLRRKNIQVQMLHFLKFHEACTNIATCLFVSWLHKHSPFCWEAHCVFSGQSHFSIVGL